jgi:hypothetical protein
MKFAEDLKMASSPDTGRQVDAHSLAAASGFRRFNKGLKISTLVFSKRNLKDLLWTRANPE